MQQVLSILLKKNQDQQMSEFFALCSYKLFGRVMNMTCCYSVLSSVVYKT